MTQDDLVWAHLAEHGSITQLEATALYGITRLAAIIHKLRHKYGAKIQTVTVTDVNRYGRPVRYARYYL